MRDWILSAMPAMDSRRVGAMASRLGWSGSTPTTLEAAGRDLDVTRERVRQIQKKLEGRLAQTRAPNLRLLHRAAAHLAASDDPTLSPGAILKESGLAGTVLPTSGVRRFLELAHLSHVAQLDRALLEMEQWQTEVSLVVREARRLAGAVGVVSVDWLTPSLPDVDAPRDAIRDSLEALGWVHFLDAEWFWSPRVPIRRNRLRNLLRKMLAACGPLAVGDIIGGLDRQRRLGRLPRVPSAQAIHLFAEAHPEFTVTPDGAISSSEHLDPIAELDVTEETLYLIIKATDDGFLDRRVFEEEAVARGINPNTFSVYTSYSPILDNPTIDRWALRGARISPAALAAHVTSSRQRRYLHTEWLPDGTLRIDRELPTLHSTVISIPTSLVRFVVGREFSATDASGSSLGSIRFNENGGSWGYSQFIESHRPHKGDIIRLDLNLAAGSVVLSCARRADED